MHRFRMRELRLHRSSNERGSALGTSLLLILFFVVFALTLINISTFDLRTVNRNGQKQLAFGAAQAGIDRAIAELTGDPRTGLAKEVFTAVQSDGSRYTVSFDSDGSGPWCVNNLANFGTAVGFSGRTVPPQHASLFAIGVSPTGETSTVECLIRLEGLPFAVAGTQTTTLNTARVVGIDKLSDVDGLLNGLATGLLGNVASGIVGGLLDNAIGNLITNTVNPVIGAITGGSQRADIYSGSGAADSTTLTSTSVTGNLRSVGGFRDIPGILGNHIAEEVLTYDDPYTLPDIRISDFNTQSTPGTLFLTPVQARQRASLSVGGLTTALGGILDLTGGLIGVPGLGGVASSLNLDDINPSAKFSGSIYIDGDLDLSLLDVMIMDRATIYVNGNFSAGVLMGTGAIFVNGKTDLNLALPLNGSSDRIAIFSEDDINFNLVSVVQGVVYSHGNVNSTLALTVIGAVYAVNNIDPSKGHVNLGLGSTVIYSSEITSFASYWLAMRGAADAVMVYWRELN